MYLFMDVRNIIQVKKTRWMTLEGHLAYMENRNAHRVLWKNPKERDHF
jgi:hypothetical protein